MILNKIEIVSDLAHFKIPLGSQIQRTYEIPPISTVVGILQNLYGEDIDNFTLGYTIQHEGIFKDLHTIHKEIYFTKPSVQASTRFTKEPCQVHYLINPRIIIYTDIDRNMDFNEVLNLGKTDCLAKMVGFMSVDLINQVGVGYNQYTDISTGTGAIRRINTETKYNETRNMFDYKQSLVRENYEFEYDKFYDTSESQNIFLWKWQIGGKINAIS